MTGCRLRLSCTQGFGASGSTLLWRRETHCMEQGGAFMEGLGPQWLQPALGLASDSYISLVLHVCPLRGPKQNVETTNHILERNEEQAVEGGKWRAGERKSKSPNRFGWKLMAKKNEPSLWEEGFRLTLPSFLPLQANSSFSYWKRKSPLQIPSPRDKQRPTLYS